MKLFFLTISLTYLTFTLSRTPTAAAWGGSLVLIGLFLTDWKVITGKIPYIKGKYDHEVPRLVFWNFSFSLFHTVFCAINTRTHSTP